MDDIISNIQLYKSKDNKLIIPNNFSKLRIDIGLSYNAPMSNNWLKNNSNLIVFGFEPCINSCKSVSEKYLHDKINKNFFLIPIALGNKNEIKNFFVLSPDPGTSSLLEPNLTEFPNKYAVKETYDVKVFMLKDFLDKIEWNNKIQYIEYIKIDAQGFDFNILQGIGDYLIDKVVFITLEAETRQYKGSEINTVKNITDYLTSINYEIINTKKIKDPTFINKKYKHLEKQIDIYQKG